MSIDFTVNNSKPSKNFEIIEFVPEDATELDWNAFFNHSEKIYREKNPRDPLPLRETTKSALLDPIPFYDIKRWVIWDQVKKSILAFARLYLETPESPDYKDNKHIAFWYITVDKEWRRKQKFGTKLMIHLVQEASKANIQVFQAEVDNAAGVAFSYHYGGDLVLQEMEYRLYFDDINWELVHEWIKIGTTRAIGTQILTFEQVPDQYLEDFCRMFSETVNQRPTGDMDQMITVTPESRRSEEENFSNKGYIWYTMISVEPNGHISGMTECYWKPSEPYRINQGLTSVLKKYRAIGLGKLLKAEMTIFIHEHFSDAKYIATETARGNAPMIAINERLGFVLHHRKYIYKWDLDELKETLGISTE